ncbi:beta-ketoacyl-[acyl-carrier-protein] synthase family protein [Amycolatopsis samaneae]|uniref:Beta-ketoacyl-[acyl-carrier-protein] synthase family protein n=1 Tax=Amycolatopsis samaneae TaxID=664691 RepID=A0ABW5GPA8_9PSEU
MTEVVVTGLGAVTCHGFGVEALWDAVRAAGARSPEPPPDPCTPGSLGKIYRAPDPSLDGTGRVAGFASAAAREALAAAGFGELPADRAVALVLGSCMGETVPQRWGECGETVNAAGLPAAVADALGLLGAVYGVATACAAGGYALVLAADLIRAGEAEVVIAGGADGYSRAALGSFNRMNALDPLRCRPFDARRAGTVLGEGAGILVLESAAHARARGATPLAALIGAGLSCDAHHVTSPEPGGEQQARALRTATEPGPPGCVIPHGTGTRLNDEIESAVLREVVDGAAAYSLKALIGHTGGASAALAACVAVRILRTGAVPPNVPLDEPDPRCPLALSERSVALPDGASVLVNASAFGGGNAAFLLAAAR